MKNNNTLFSVISAYFFRFTKLVKAAATFKKFFANIKKLPTTTNYIHQLNSASNLSKNTLYFFPHLEKISITKTKLISFYFFYKDFYSFNFKNNKIYSEEFEEQFQEFILFIFELSFFLKKKKNFSSLILKSLLLEFEIKQNTILTQLFIINNQILLKKSSDDYDIFRFLIKAKNSLIKKVLKKKQQLKKKRLKKKNQKANSEKKLLKKKANSNKIEQQVSFLFLTTLAKINTRHGLKKRSLKIILTVLISVKKQLNLKINHWQMLYQIYKKLYFPFFIKKFNIGRRSVLIPFPIESSKKITTTARLFLNSINKRGELTFRARLFEEIRDFFENKKKPASLKAKLEKIRLVFENKKNIRFLNYKK